MTVREVMTKTPLSVNTRTTVAQAWEVLQSMDVRHLPVVNEDRELVGIVSDRDFGTTPWPNLEMNQVFGPRRIRLEQPVTAIMSADVISTDPDADLRDVVDLLLDNKIGAVPVTSPEGHVVGIVSYLDVLRAFEDSLS
jgi:CBS domain-containing protein